MAPLDRQPSEPTRLGDGFPAVLAELRRLEQERQQPTDRRAS